MSNFLMTIQFPNDQRRSQRQLSPLRLGGFAFNSVPSVRFCGQSFDQLRVISTNFDLKKMSHRRSQMNTDFGKISVAASRLGVFALNGVPFGRIGRTLPSLLFSE